MLGTFGFFAAAKEKHVKKHFLLKLHPQTDVPSCVWATLCQQEAWLWASERLSSWNIMPKVNVDVTWNAALINPKKTWNFRAAECFLPMFCEFGETVAKEGNAQNKLIFGLLLSKQLPNFQSTSCSSLWPNLPVFGSKMLTVKRPSIMFGDSQIDKFGKAAKAFVKETEVGQLAPICSLGKNISACQFHGKSMQILYCLF